MLFERFHGFYHHHPRGAPLFTALVIVLVIVAGFALMRSGSDSKDGNGSGGGA